MPKNESAKVEIDISGVKHIVSPEGDVKDSTGNVLKTKEEVAELLKGSTKTPEQIEAERVAAEKLAKESKTGELFVEGAIVDLDGVTYTIDKDGNAIDDQKKIVKTKAELKQLYDANAAGTSTSDTNYISEVQKATNLVILKDEKPIEYENTVEGFAGYVKDAHQLGVEIGKKQREEELFNKMPILKQVISHLVLNNGDLSNFNNTVDYTKIKLTDDEQQWENIYVAAKVEQGMDKKEAQDMFKYLKDDKKAKPAAESSLLYLSQTQTARNKQADELLAKQEIQAQQEEEAYWNEVSGIIKNKTIKVKDSVFSIPDVIRVKDKEGRTVVKTLDDFVNYMSAPINVNINGKTFTTTKLEYDRYLDEEAKNSNDEVLDAYRRFTNFDDSQLISKSVKAEQVKNVIKLTNKAQSSTGGTKPSGSTQINLPLK